MEIKFGIITIVYLLLLWGFERLSGARDRAFESYRTTAERIIKRLGLHVDLYQEEMRGCEQVMIALKSRLDMHEGRTTEQEHIKEVRLLSVSRDRMNLECARIRGEIRKIETPPEGGDVE